MDIKPFDPDFAHRPEVSRGWLKNTPETIPRKRSDDRFI